jgi:hypothetical protein
MKVEEYFGDKIERRIRFYESCLKKIDAAYLAEVEQVVKRRFKDDPMWARFFRESVQPNYNAGELDHIRFLKTRGKIIEADRALERFRNRVEFVEQHLVRRYLSSYDNLSRGGKKSAAAKRASADGRADQLRREWSKWRAKGYLKGEADQMVARAFESSTKSVYRARSKSDTNS